jgi:hypothetical protein
MAPCSRPAIPVKGLNVEAPGYVPSTARFVNGACASSEFK